MSQEEGFVIEHEGLYLGIPYPIVGNSVGFHPISTNTFFFPDHVYQDCKSAMDVLSKALAVSGFNDRIALLKCKARRAVRVGSKIYVEQTPTNQELTDNKATALAKEHSVYSFHAWRNFTSQSGHSVPYDAFVAICEYSEGVRNNGK